MSNDTRELIFREISRERDRQDSKWGYPQNNTLAQWGNILTEEHGEFIKELNEIDFGRQKNPSKFIDELFQMTAVAVSILEHLHGGHLKKEGEA